MDANRLDELMSEGLVVDVSATGSVGVTSGVGAPELTLWTDPEGQFTDYAHGEMLREAKAQGWELLSSVQPLYGQGLRFATENAPDAIQHNSTRIGSATWEFMKENPGLWVVCAPSVSVDGCTENYPDQGELCGRCEEIENQGTDGWVLAHKATA